MSGSEGFVVAVRRRGRVADGLALGAVPAVLVGVFVLSRSTRVSLGFAYTDPTLSTAYTAHFVHLSVGHLLTNLLVYLLVAPTVYLLCLLAGEHGHRLFRAAFPTFLGVFPFVLSALNLVFLRDRLSVGFSGVNMALFGLLPLALSMYADAQFDDDLDGTQSPLLFFAGMAIVALVAVPPTMQSLGIALAAVLSSVLYFEGVLGEVSFPGLEDLRAVSRRPGYFELLVVGASLFVLIPVVAFANARVGGDVVNLYTHLLGFAMAFMVSFLFFRVRIRG